MPTLNIVRDIDPMNPREDEHLGTMVCWHRRVTLGDVQTKLDPVRCANEEIPENSVVLPLYLYEHSGMTIRTTPFSDPWDSGQVGWIYADPDKVAKELDLSRPADLIRKKVEAILRSEVRIYDLYLQDEVWGYMYGEESCWGFLGDTLEETGLKDSVPQEALPQLEQAWDRRC
jgi:hypothetical protein